MGVPSPGLNQITFAVCDGRHETSITFSEIALFKIATAVKIGMPKTKRKWIKSAAALDTQTKWISIFQLDCRHACSQVRSSMSSMGSAYIIKTISNSRRRLRVVVNQFWRSDPWHCLYRRPSKGSHTHWQQVTLCNISLQHCSFRPFVTSCCMKLKYCDLSLLLLPQVIFFPGSFVA